MSLQVWLPLLNNINNQGLATITSSGTPAYKSNGKIGACLDLSKQVSFNCPSLNGVKEFSIAFWAKVNSDTSLSSNWVDVIGFTDKKDDGTTGQLRWETCYGSGYESRGISGHNNVTYATTNGPNSEPTTKDTWHHIVCVVGTDVKEYRDGILTGTWTANGGSLTGSFWLGQTDVINGEINDVRIYDHALSTKEVKELAKGLVLHYKLDGKDETTTNLITTGNISTTSCYNGAKSKYGYGAETDIYNTTGTFQGRDCVKVYMGTAGQSAHPFPVLAYSPAVNGYKTISFDYYPTILDKLVFYSYNSNSPCTWSYNVDGVKDSSLTAVTSVTVPVKTNKWNHVELTLYNTGTVADGWNYFQIGNGNHTSTTTDYWLFSNVQVEAKDHATPFTLGTRTYTTEYDCSGYGYNGIVSGTLISSSDTPRYNGCTKFTTGAKISSSTGMITTPNPVFSCNFWIKMPSATYSTWSDVVTFLGSAIIRMETFNTTGTGLSWYNYPIGTSSGIPTNGTVNNTDWNMFTLTCDGTNWRTYKNGVLANTVALSGTAWTPNGQISLGDGGMYCQLSDFRIYATALSADDIKELYQTAASIDNHGNVYAYELEEV